PDGKLVAYVVVATDWTKNDFVRHIWIVGADGSGLRRVTNDSISGWNARWSPDSKWLSFQAARGGPTQVYAVPAAGGTAAQLTKADNGVDDYRWSPDGRSLAYLSSGQVVAAQPEPKEYRTVGNDGKYSASLWIVDVSSMTAAPAAGERVTDPKSFV